MPQKTSKANGHAEPSDRTNGKSERGTPNGHASDCAERKETPMHLNRAAADDAGGLLVASAALPAAAGANPEACAAVAPAEAHGARLRENGAAPRSQGRGSKGSGKKKKDEALEKQKAPEIPGGTEPLPIDGPEFVEAVHERLDLIALQVMLLRSKDEKIAQRELAYLRELRYGKTVAPSAADDEIPKIIFDAPRPNRGSTTSAS
jgi:hypothetical protein